jgi:hypothetical protein
MKRFFIIAFFLGISTALYSMEIHEVDGEFQGFRYDGKTQQISFMYRTRKIAFDMPDAEMRDFKRVLATAHNSKTRIAIAIGCNIKIIDDGLLIDAYEFLDRRTIISRIQFTPIKDLLNVKTDNGRYYQINLESGLSIFTGKDLPKDQPPIANRDAINESPQQKPPRPTRKLYPRPECSRL